MTPAELALFHMREAEKIGHALPQPAAWLKANRQKLKRFHIKAVLLIIAKSSGGKTRDRAKQLLGEMR